MATEALVVPFLSLPLFRNLKAQQLGEIARRAERIIYRPGDTIVAEDQNSDAAILIVSGTCARQTKAGDTANDELLPEGSLIAELAMLVEVVHPATIVAKDQVKALRLSREKMHELMQTDMDLASHFSSHILKRLHAMAKDLLSVDGLLSNSADVAKTAATQLTLEKPTTAHAAR
jgi:CRP-like cAMP-binding protein